MKSPLLAFFGAALLAGCDNGSSTQASTSSETQTALQELADNVHAYSFVFPSGSGGRAARVLATTPDSCTPAEQTWIRDGVPQEETVEGEILDSSLWHIEREDLAVGLDGKPKTCGEGGAFHVAYRYAGNRNGSMRYFVKGVKFGADIRQGFDGFRDTSVSIYPTGFEILSYEWANYSTPIPDTRYGGIPKVHATFGKGRFLIVTDSNYSCPVPGFADCAPILDLSEGNRLVGWMTYVLPLTIFDSTLQPIPARPIVTTLPPDTIGLAVLSAKIVSDSVRLSVRVKLPSSTAAPGDLTRLCIACFATSSATVFGSRYIDLTAEQIERGVRLEWAVPTFPFTPFSAVVSLLRRYPNWPSQFAHSPDSLSGWTVVAESIIDTSSTPH